MDKAEDIMVIRMPVGMRKFRDPKKPREATHLKYEKPMSAPPSTRCVWPIDSRFTAASATRDPLHNMYLGTIE